MTVGIYILACIPTREIYIGKSRNLENRKRGHFSAFRRGNHSNRLLRERAAQHGAEAFHFQILQTFEGLEGDELHRALSKAEVKWIKQLNPQLNFDFTGRRWPPKAYWQNPEVRKQASDRMKKYWQRRKGGIE